MDDPFLAEAKRLAARGNLRIMPKRTASGAVRTFLVYRDTAPRLTYVGERATSQGLRDFVRQLTRCEGRAAA